MPPRGSHGPRRRSLCAASAAQAHLVAGQTFALLFSYQAAGPVSRASGGGFPVNCVPRSAADAWQRCEDHQGRARKEVSVRYAFTSPAGAVLRSCTALYHGRPGERFLCPGCVLPRRRRRRPRIGRTCPGNPARTGKRGVPVNPVPWMCVRHGASLRFRLQAVPPRGVCRCPPEGFPVFQGASWYDGTLSRYVGIYFLCRIL